MNNKIVINKEETVFQLLPKDRQRLGRSNDAFTSVEIKQINPNDKDDDFGRLCFYQNYTGDMQKHENEFSLQIRAAQSLSGKSKPRTIIASISITDSEIIAMAEFVQKRRIKHGTVNKSGKILE